MKKFAIENPMNYTFDIKRILSKSDLGSPLRIREASRVRHTYCLSQLLTVGALVLSGSFFLSVTLAVQLGESELRRDTDPNQFCCLTHDEGTATLTKPNGSRLIRPYIF